VAAVKAYPVGALKSDLRNLDPLIAMLPKEQRP
jgi:hypothetical protein